MIAYIRSGALPALLCVLQVAFAAGFTISDAVPMPNPSAPTVKNDSIAKGPGKRWLSWGGLDGNASLGLGRNVETGSWLGSSGDLAGGRVGLTLGFGSVDARLGIGAFYSAITRGSVSDSRYSSAFHPGLDQLYLSRTFDIFAWPSALQAGMFPWKANPDAAILGEYLARYKSYPASIHRQGQPWDSLGGLDVRVQGLRFAASTPGGAWKLEALLLADAPYSGDGYDFSTVYAVDVRLPRGFEIGAGLENRGFATTQARLQQPVRRDNDDFFILDTVMTGTANDTAFLEFPDDILLSARVAVDLRLLFGRKPHSDRSGRLFLETALLGWHNLASFSGNRMDRLIWTAGIYLPSFGLLDVLCLQLEHQRLGREAGYGVNTIPSPVPQGNGEWMPHYAEARTPFPGKDLKWGLFASKDVRSWLAVQIRYLDQPQNRGSYFLLSDRESAQDRTFYTRIMMRY